MVKLKNVLSASLLLGAVISSSAHADFINLSGDSFSIGALFNVSIETSGTNVIDASGSFEGKTVTGISLFNPTGTAFNFYNSSSDFDFSFTVDPVYASSGSESVRFYTNVGTVEYQIGEVFDATSGDSHVVAFPGDVNGVPQTRALASISIASTPAVSAVPEPASYAMFLAGLGLMGFVARRKI